MLAPSVGKYNYAYPLPTVEQSATMSARPKEATVSDRKYRQRGYQDTGQKSEKRETSARPVKKDTFGPRAIQMPGTRNVSRCSQCGNVLQSLSEPVGQCPK